MKSSVYIAAGWSTYHRASHPRYALLLCSTEMPNHEGKKKGSHTIITTPKKSPSPLKCLSSHWINYPKLCLFPFALLFLGLAGRNEVHSQRHEEDRVLLPAVVTKAVHSIRARAICSEGSTEFGQTVYFCYCKQLILHHCTKCTSVPLCLGKFWIQGALPYWS